MKIISCNEIELESIKLNTYQLAHRLFNKQWSKVLKKNVLQINDGIGILLYDPAVDKVVMVKQFRIGSLNDPCGPWLIEIVAGMLEIGESHKAVAFREVMEETGITATEILPMISYFVNPSYTTQKMHLYCIKIDVNLINFKFTYGVTAEDEDIQAFIMTADEAYKNILTGKINNNLTITALLWLQLNKSLIHDKWR